jgi:hypothetical protein
MKKCKSCKTEIDIKATKCPQCQTDQRGWCRRHPILTGFLGLIVFFIIVGAIGGSRSATTTTTSTTQSNTTTGASTQAGEATTAAPSKDDLLSKNKPDIKHLTTLTADYIGKSFTLYVQAKTDNYYNYGFNDQNSYYSLKLWDNSVGGDYSGLYAYLDKTQPENKALVEELLNTTAFLKVNISIPASKYEQGSNAFAQIDSWEEVK